jgi:cell division protein ZapA
MPHVTVIINGRQYRLGCQEGEDEHLVRLAADLDRRINDLRTRHGEIGDARLTIMAALTIADEVAETNAKVRKIEAELASLRDVRLAFAERATAAQTGVATALNAAAERIEQMARRLNESAPDGGVGMR